MWKFKILHMWNDEMLVVKPGEGTTVSGKVAVQPENVAPS